MKWENRTSTIAYLTAGALAATALLMASLAFAHMPQLPALVGPGSGRLYRQVTGFIALGLVLLTLVTSLRLRTRVRVPLPRGPARGIHMVAGLLPLAAILFHTGARWGRNLNSCLLGCLLAGILVALAGKLGDNRRLHRLAAAAARVPGGGAASPLRGAAPRISGPWRRLWPRLHVYLIVTLLVLVAFHVLAAYYF